MRRAVTILVGALVVLAGGAAAAPEPTHPVVACETLVGLRLLMGDGATDHATALARLSRHPACRLVPRDRVGTAEHRAMIGGAPFECLTVRGEDRCAWVMP